MSSHCCLQGENSVKLEAGSAQLSLCGLGVQHRKLSSDPFLNARILCKPLMSHCGSGGGVIHVSTVRHRGMEQQMIPTEPCPAQGLGKMHFSHSLSGGPALEPSFGGILGRPAAPVPTWWSLGTLCLHQCCCSLPSADTSLPSAPRMCCLSRSMCKDFSSLASPLLNQWRQIRSCGAKLSINCSPLRTASAASPEKSKLFQNVTGITAFPPSAGELWAFLGGL